MPNSTCYVVTMKLRENVVFNGLINRTIRQGNSTTALMIVGNWFNLTVRVVDHNDEEVKTFDYAHNPQELLQNFIMKSNQSSHGAQYPVLFLPYSRKLCEMSVKTYTPQGETTQMYEVLKYPKMIEIIPGQFRYINTNTICEKEVRMRELVDAQECKLRYNTDVIVPNYITQETSKIPHPAEILGDVNVTQGNCYFFCSPGDIVHFKACEDPDKSFDLVGEVDRIKWSFSRTTDRIYVGAPVFTLSGIFNYNYPMLSAERQKAVYVQFTQLPDELEKYNKALGDNFAQFVQTNQQSTEVVRKQTLSSQAVAIKKRQIAVSSQSVIEEMVALAKKTKTTEETAEPELDIEKSLPIARTKALRLTRNLGISSLLKGKAKDAGPPTITGPLPAAAPWIPPHLVNQEPLTTEPPPYTATCMSLPSLPSLPTTTQFTPAYYSKPSLPSTTQFTPAYYSNFGPTYMMPTPSMNSTYSLFHYPQPFTMFSSAPSPFFLSKTAPNVPNPNSSPTDS